MILIHTEKKNYYVILKLKLQTYYMDKVNLLIFSFKD